MLFRDETNAYHNPSRVTHHTLLCLHLSFLPVHHHEQLDHEDWASHSWSTKIQNQWNYTINHKKHLISSNFQPSQIAFTCIECPPMLQVPCSINFLATLSFSKVTKQKFFGSLSLDLSMGRMTCIIKYIDQWKMIKKETNLSYCPKLRKMLSDLIFSNTGVG